MDKMDSREILFTQARKVLDTLLINGSSFDVIGYSQTKDGFEFTLDKDLRQIRCRQVNGSQEFIFCAGQGCDFHPSFQSVKCLKCNAGSKSIPQSPSPHQPTYPVPRFINVIFSEDAVRPSKRKRKNIQIASSCSNSSGFFSKSPTPRRNAVRECRQNNDNNNYNEDSSSADERQVIGSRKSSTGVGEGADLDEDGGAKNKGLTPCRRERTVKRRTRTGCDVIDKSEDDKSGGAIVNMVQCDNCDSARVKVESEEESKYSSRSVHSDDSDLKVIEEIEKGSKTDHHILNYDPTSFQTQTSTSSIEDEEPLPTVRSESSDSDSRSIEYEALLAEVVKQAILPHHLK